MRWRRAAWCLNGMPVSVAAQPWMADLAAPPLLARLPPCTNALRRRSRRRFGYAIEPRQCLCGEIQSTPHLTVPKAPSDPLDRVGDPCSVLALARRVGRPALGGLCHVPDAHGEMEPVEQVAGRADARRLAEGARPVGAVARDD